MKRGVSLMEVLFALTISSIVVLGLLTMYTKGQHYFVNQSALGDALEESRYPFACLSRDVKTAHSVAASRTVGSTAYVTSANTLILNLPSVDAGGVILENPGEPLGTHLDCVVYAVSGGKLLRLYDAKDGVSGRPDGSRYLADNVSGLTFTYYNESGAVLTSGFVAAASVGAQVSVSWRGAGSRTFVRTLDSKFKLRNK